MEFSEFLSVFETFSRVSPGTDEGAIAYFILRQHKPELAHKLRNSMFDPFDQKKLKETSLNFIKENW